MSSGANSNIDPTGWNWDSQYRKYWRYARNSDGSFRLDAHGNYDRIWQTENAPAVEQSNVHMNYNVQLQMSTQPSQPLTIAYAAPHQYTSHDATPKASDFARYKQSSGGASDAAQPRARVDSSHVPRMAPGAPDNVRYQLEFRGTPERGWSEPLDSSYCVRTHAQEYNFFKQGRVFAMLWAETAGQPLSNNRTPTENSRFTAHPNSGLSQGKHGEKIYSSIRRFVIVRVNRQKHFVEACAITTYGGRGVMKPGCNASEHTIVHIQGHPVRYLDGEWQKGMIKDAIAIEPTDKNEQMDPYSRLRLGKTYTIECNVKVRDIGMVAKQDRTKFLRYYQDEKDVGFEADESNDDVPGTVYPPVASSSWTAQHGGQGYHHYGQQGY